jgi:hypothetical protein
LPDNPSAQIGSLHGGGQSDVVVVELVVVVREVVVEDVFVEDVLEVVGALQPLQSM